MVGPRLVASLACMVVAASTLQSGGARVQPVIRPAGAALVGVWVQYAAAAGGDVWDNGGMYRVALHGEKLDMTVESLREMSPEMGATSGLSEVKFDGKTWSFRSAWPDGRTGVFTLHRVGDDLFEGSAQDADGSNPPQREIWKRIAFVGDEESGELATNTYVEVENETRKVFSTHGALIMVWWIPTEFWELVFASAAPADPAPSRERVLRAVRTLSVVAVVDGRPVSTANSGDPPGPSPYRSADEIRKNLKFIALDGSEALPLPNDDEVVRSIAPTLEPLGRVLSHVPDAARAHVRFFYFRTADASGAPKFTARSSGDLALDYDDTRLVWHLPLSVFVAGKRCPSCNDSLRGGYRFCPFDGTKLPPSERR
jgi:hypothetical protein